MGTRLPRVESWLCHFFLIKLYFTYCVHVSVSVRVEVRGPVGADSLPHGSWGSNLVISPHAVSTEPSPWPSTYFG